MSSQWQVQRIMEESSDIVKSAKKVKTFSIMASLPCLHALSYGSAATKELVA